jgi:hypothetical protein
MYRVTAITLLLISISFAGCLNEEEEAHVIVGNWYFNEVLAYSFYSNGTMTHPSWQGSWSTENNNLTIIDDVWKYNFSMLYSVLDGFLFLAPSENYCEVYSRNPISLELWSSKLKNLSLPSFCDDPWDLNRPAQVNPGLYSFNSADHWDNTSNGTDDSLIVLWWKEAPEDMLWTNLEIQITGEDGLPYTCKTDNSTYCTIIQHGSDDNSWEISEVLHLIENEFDLCNTDIDDERRTWWFDFKISDTRSGTTLIGTNSVQVK